MMQITRNIQKFTYDELTELRQFVKTHRYDFDKDHYHSCYLAHSAFDTNCHTCFMPEHLWKLWDEIISPTT